MRIVLKLFLAGVLSLTALTARADPATDAAVAQINTFNETLLQSMKSPKGREAGLGAAIDKTFNTPVMTQFVVGPTWAKLTPTEKQSVQGAMRNYMVARFASEFDSYNGEKFGVEQNPKVRGVDALVKTTIQAPKSEAEHVDYRMRKYGEAWKVIDVYYNGVSDLTTQRADFAATAQTSGAAGLLKKIDEATKKLK